MNMNKEDFIRQIDSFKELEKNWSDGKQGEEFDDIEIDNFKQKFFELKPDDIPFPFPVPTQDGGIVLVWESGDKSAELEFSGLKYDSEIYGLLLNIRDMDDEGWEFTLKFEDFSLALERVLKYLYEELA